jgi:hypothetical protein
MPAQSKQQQKFMGLVHAIQKGDVPASDASPEAQKVAQDMKPSDVKDFASTSHKGLPKKVKQEIVKRLKEYAMTLPNHHAKPAAPMDSLRSDDEMDLQKEDRVPQGFFQGTTTRDYHTKLATTPRKKYDKTNFEPAHSGQEDLEEAFDELEHLKLLNLAMKAIPGSPKQKEIIKKLNQVRIAGGMKPLKEASPCWDGYKQVGMKTKGGRQVPNCVKESVNEALDPKAEKFLDAIQVNDRSIKDLKNITVDATPQGNWSVYYKGKRMFTLNGKMLDDKTIMKYGLEHMDESLSEGKKIQKSVNEAAMNPVKKLVNAILKKHKVQAMKTYASSVRGAHNIINGGYRWEGDWHLGFYGNVPQDVVEKVAAEMEKAGVKYVKVKKGHISADFSKTGLSEATLNELKLNDLVGNQYKYVIGSGEEKSLGTNDKKYVLEMIAKALETYLYDHNFALNYLDGSQRKQYESFFEKEVLKPMLSKIDFTLNTFFTLDKDKVKWKLSSNDTRKMMDEIFRKNSKIPADIKREYYDYRLDYAGVKLKESSKVDIKEYGQALDLHFILNKDAKLDGTPEPKKAIGEELSLDEREMVIGIIEILKQVEDPKNRMRIALNMLKKFKEENIEFDYKKFIDHLKEYSMGSYEYDKGNRELGESIIKSMKKVVLDLLPTNTLARHASDPSRNKEFVEKIVKELGTLLNRFYKQNDIDVVLK